jgi:uncharacterized protein (TIGR02996 family)
MTVYFVYRSHYDDPAGKRLERFSDPTVLDWFRNHWLLLADSTASTQELLGFYPYGFDSLFRRAIENALPPPESDEQLGEYLSEHLYSEGPILYQPHLLTVQTGDDELMVCYYVFDDIYLSQHAQRAAYLLKEGWRLPAEQTDNRVFEPSEPSDDCSHHGTGVGATWVAIFAFQDSGNLIELGCASRFEGVRIPDLCRYLACGPDPSDRWSNYLLLLRSQLLASPITSDPFEDCFRLALLDQPDDETTWDAYSDWLQEQGQRRAGLVVLERALQSVRHFPVTQLPHQAWEVLGSASIQEAVRIPLPQARQNLAQVMIDNPSSARFRHDPARSRIQVEEHLAQLCLHVARWSDTDLYHQWIFFDDRWAAAHPDLANGILRYQRCWDVLSPDGPHDPE